MTEKTLSEKRRSIVIQCFYILHQENVEHKIESESGTRQQQFFGVLSKLEISFEFNVGFNVRKSTIGSKVSARGLKKPCYSSLTSNPQFFRKFPSAREEIRSRTRCSGKGLNLVFDSSYFLEFPILRFLKVLPNVQVRSFTCYVRRIFSACCFKIPVISNLDSGKGERPKILLFIGRESWLHYLG